MQVQLGLSGLGRGYLTIEQYMPYLLAIRASLVDRVVAPVQVGVRPDGGCCNLQNGLPAAAPLRTAGAPHCRLREITLLLG